MKHYGPLLDGVMRACTSTFRFREGKLETLNDEQVRIEPDHITAAPRLLTYSSTVEFEKI
jgi:hypothetical protein